MKINIPFLIAGELIQRAEHTEKILFKSHESEIITPKLNDEDLKKVSESIKNLDALHDLSTEEIISFLVKVGDKWKKGNKIRDEAVKSLIDITGYSKEMIEFSMDQISLILTKGYLQMLLESELGNNKIMDEWTKRGEALVHCQPKGTVLHILAGNAPTISVMSLIRGLMTKNCNILKMPSQDLVTLSHFVQVFSQVDPNNPITKSISVLYWPNSKTDILDKLVSLSDAICVWGSLEAVNAIKSHSQDKELLLFGPRRGIQLFGKEIHSSPNIKDIAKNAAHDLVIFDQEACFSPQLAFVEGSREQVTKFAHVLKDALIEESKSIPKGKMTLQQTASLSHSRRSSLFLGDEVIHPDNFDFTLIVSDKIEHANSHPHGRTLYLIPINDIADATKYIGHETQAVAIEPFSRAIKLREQLTRKGVDRITHIGKMPYFAPGAPHDGIYPLSRLVRWVKSR